MADSPPYSDTGDDPGGPTRGSTTGTPRWVKVGGVVALVLVLVLVVVMLVGGGSHGPGRHTGSDDARGRTPPAGATGDRSPSGDGPRGHTPPEGGHRGP